MTRPADQITPLQALLGSSAMLLIAAAIVAALGQLVQPDERRPPLGAPAQDGERDLCPVTRGPAADEPVVVMADELVECPASFDGVTVSYRGEAVRAILRRGRRSWVHLNDDPYALRLGPLYDHRTAVGGNSGIPVSIPTAVADTIAHVGGPRHRGDILEVAGVFHRADPRDGGGPAIQADAVRITEAGSAVRRSVDRARVIVAAAISIAALVAALVAHTASRRRPRLSWSRAAHTSG